MSISFLDDGYDVLPEIALNDDGRVICGSKAAYLSQFPKHMVVFDGNLCTKSKGNIWYGDIDITRDTTRLQEIATELGEDLYIFHERDCVDEKENIKWENALKVIRKPRRKKVKPETSEDVVTEVETTELTDIEIEATEAETDENEVTADAET